MSKRLFYLSVCLFWIVCGGCGKNTEDDVQVDLEKKDIVILEEQKIIENIYHQNNSSATKRVRSIMYTQSESGDEQELFKLVHISDPHISGYSIDNKHHSPINFIHSIRFANQINLRINAIAVTGDLIGFSKEKINAIGYIDSFVTHFRKNNRIPSVVCIGNHDNNYLMDPLLDIFVIPRDELNTCLFTNDPFRKGSDKKENYYYLDVPNPQGGVIRLISLDMIDHAGTVYDALHQAYYSQKQIDWLGNIALKERMTEQHSIVILNHFPFEPKRSAKEHSYLSDGLFVHSWQMIPEIIEAFRSKTTIQKRYPNMVNQSASPISVNYDFSDNEGEFICHLGGHAHCFACFELKELENENPLLPKQRMILCSNQSPTESVGIYNKTVRKNKHISSNNFNIYTFDTSNKTIHLTFFGANTFMSDASLPEIISFPYLYSDY
ncbi:metallophosphoesterase [Parabacteroides sp. OttesenSCG-928-J18]|nr:metallophosphoesterase [Parabacteroides sp. OttesenSCG-928-J18]